MDLSLVYFPSAVAIGSLHALEPGHAKTLTAAYLIGTKGTKRDAIVLGLSVALTHSIVVIGLVLVAVILGRESFTEQAEYYLALGSSVLVICLGFWLFVRRMASLKRKKSTAGHGHDDDHAHHEHDEHHHTAHDHSHLSDDEHARAHAADLPDYVERGEKPSLVQIMAFGAAGGLVPCPAAVSVMLLSLSLSQSGKGLIMVFGFSFGLAITLVGLGLLVVTGLSKIASTGRLSKLINYAPALAAIMVMFSGAVGLLVTLSKHA